jgi:hypothetical protein
MSVDSAKLIIEVRAGLIPERADPGFSRQWAISSSQWEAAQEADREAGEAYGPPLGGVEELLSTVVGKAQGYAGLLMLQPNRVNWVRTDWVWF